jgi:hypothetical protein
MQVYNMAKNKMVNLKEIAKNEKVTLIATTQDGSGYPKDTNEAIIGFDSFDQASVMADKYNLDIILFRKKDGQALYSDMGAAYGPMTNNASEYGDNYDEYSSSSFEDEKEFISNNVTDLIAHAESFDEMQDILKTYKDTWQMIDNLDEDEILIMLDGQPYETVKTKTMSFSHDGTTLIIGLSNPKK